MDRFESILKTIGCAASGVIGWLFGGFDILFGALLFFMALDFVTGIIKGMMLRSDKSANGALSSNAAFNGVLKKALILMVVAASAMADKALSPDNVILRTMVTGYYIACEAISLCENAITCGVPLPKGFRQLFEGIKEEEDGE